MKKKIIISLGIIVILILTILSYKFVAGNVMKEKTYSYLETVGYTQKDIADVEIKHMLINKIMGYNAWRIFVEFKREPNIIFAFTYRDDQIIKQGTASKITQLDKEEIIRYDTMFDNGELKITETNTGTLQTPIPEVVDIIDIATRDQIPCDEAEQQFYADAEYIYFYPCIKSKYVIVRYSDNTEETVENALKNKNITIADLDRFEIAYIKKKR